MNAPLITNAAGGWFLQRVRSTVPTGLTALVERRASSRGLMPPLHAHAESVSYYVDRGELTFFIEDEVVRASAGDVVVVPARAAHTYRTESDHVRWLVLGAARVRAALTDLALASPGSTDGSRAAPLRGMTILAAPGTLPGARLAA